MKYCDAIWIYALCDAVSGECFYVGQTRDIQKRLTRHAHHFKRRRDSLKMVLLSVVRDPKAAGDKETLWIERMKDQGEPLENVRSLGFCPTGSTFSPFRFRCMDDGRIFEGYAQAGRALGVTRDYVQKAERNANGEPFQVSGKMLQAEHL